MAKLRLLVVDDEPLARERVRALLRAETDVEIAGECDNGLSAIMAIRTDPPDLVLMDVQMPGCDGLAVVSSLPEEQRPAVIFVTGHEQFAVDAFAVQAVDYVLKPFDRERLAQAVHRAREHLRLRRARALEDRLQQLLPDPGTRTPERLVFRADGRVFFVRPEEIVWIEAANNYSLLHFLGCRRLMVREPIGALEQRLKPGAFVRVSRSAIVRVDCVRELHPTEHGDYTIVLTDGHRVALSRQLRSRLEMFADPS